MRSNRLPLPRWKPPLPHKKSEQPLPQPRASRSTPRPGRGLGERSDRRLHSAGLGRDGLYLHGGHGLGLRKLAVQNLLGLGLLDLRHVFVKRLRLWCHSCCGQGRRLREEGAASLETLAGSARVLTAAAAAQCGLVRLQRPRDGHSQRHLMANQVPKWDAVQQPELRLVCDQDGANGRPKVNVLCLALPSHGEQTQN